MSSRTRSTRSMVNGMVGSSPVSTAITSWPCGVSPRAIMRAMAVSSSTSSTFIGRSIVGDGIRVEGGRDGMAGERQTDEQTWGRVGAVIAILLLAIIVAGAIGVIENE